MQAGKMKVNPTQTAALYKPVLLGVTTKSDFAKEELRNPRSLSRKKLSSVSKMTKTTPRSKSRKLSKTPTKKPVSNERKRSVVHQPAFLKNVVVSP
jgi:hypothetical protein